MGKSFVLLSLCINMFPCIHKMLNKNSPSCKAHYFLGRVLQVCEVKIVTCGGQEKSEVSCMFYDLLTSVNKVKVLHEMYH